ncbi:MAG: dialkylresorcinol condensing enzyme [Deltaproteobacteria bacterium]|nr:dialkylresorcinol condensing enzyme [Deltaproteobacteria bacterium]
MKRILILHYSQTGQLNRAVKSMVAPLEASGTFEVVWQELVPKKPYPYPWPVLDFFDVFPESVYLDPPELKPLESIKDRDFDLILLAYQVWFLSPSLPITAFLKSEEAKKILKDKPIITFIACRGMWLCGHDKVKSMLQARGAKLIDNVVLVDQGPPWATFVTTPRWLLTGKKGGFWGIFPPAGVSDKDIDGASRFGKALVDARNRIDKDLHSPLLKGLGAVKVNPRYIAGEKMVHRSFYIWGKLFRSIGKPGHPLRRMMLIIYIMFLITMILTVMPLGVIIRFIMRPFMEKKLQSKVRKLEEPSGSSTERVTDYV